MKLKSTEGQSLIEVLAGLAMAVLIVAALINMVTASLRSANFAKTTSQATKYAQEAIEWLRSQRDLPGRTWDQFKLSLLSTDNSKVWCVKDVTVGLPVVSGACASDQYVCYGGCTDAEKTIFFRQITVARDLSNADRLNIKVTVSWKDQALADHKSELTTILTNTGKWK